MFQVWEFPHTKLTETTTRAEASAALDAECQRRYGAAVVADDDAGCFRFEVRDGTDRPVAWLTYHPNISMPYVSPIFFDEEGQQ